MMSRRMARKMSNRKRRWFVDNIIMHHKRLHDRNREMVINNARTRALARKKVKEEKPNLSNSTLQYSRTNNNSRWQTKVNTKERGEEIRQRIEAKSLRANSRWASLIRNDREANGSYSAN